MTPLQSFTSIRRYYFRSACARIDWEHACFGGRDLEQMTLADFRELYARAALAALEIIRTRSEQAWSWRVQ